MSLEETMM